jgi:hypothetical protein
MSRSNQKSRKQRGGKNELTWELDERDRVFPKGKKHKEHEVLWTEKPINIHGFDGKYIGEYYLDKNGHALMQGRGRFVYNDENPANGMCTIYDGYWKKNKKHGAIDFEYRNGDKGYAEFVNDVLDRYDKWHFAPTYNYADGNVYDGELVIKNGKAVPVNYDKVKPRTVFNFAPGPNEFLDRNGDFVKVNKRDAKRGFLMSQSENMREIVPPTPANSPNNKPVVVRKSHSRGIRGRLSDIRDSRLTGEGEGPMDRDKELEDVRAIIKAQKKPSPLRVVHKKKLSPITKKGGYMRRNKKAGKTRKNTT